MRSVIFGGTGRSGLAVAEALLNRSATVVLFLRASSVVPTSLVGRVEEFRGDSSDPASVSAGLENADAAIICVGDSSLLRASTFRGDVTRAVVGAAQAGGNDTMRVVAVSALGARESGPQLPWYIRAFALFALQQPLRDHAVQEEAMEKLPADRWMVVRPVMLVAGAASDADVHATADGVVPRMMITRSDVGKFIAKQLFGDSSKSWWGHHVAISAA